MTLLLVAIIELFGFVQTSDAQGEFIASKDVEATAALPANCNQAAAGISTEVLRPIRDANPPAPSRRDEPPEPNVWLQFDIDISLPDHLRIKEATLTLPSEWPNAAVFDLACGPPNLERGSGVFRQEGKRLIAERKYIEPLVYVLPETCLKSPLTQLRMRVRPDPQAFASGNERPAGEVARDLVSRVALRILRIDDNKASSPADVPVALKTSQVSYSAGETIGFQFHVANPDRAGAMLEVFRLGRTMDRVYVRKGVNASAQRVAPYAFRDGMTWPVGLRFRVPGEWKPGYYAAKLSSTTFHNWHPFLVSPKVGKPAPVAIIASTNTWQAYNNPIPLRISRANCCENSGFGSLYFHNFYSCLNTDASRVVSFDRPYSQWQRVLRDVSAARTTDGRVQPRSHYQSFSDFEQETAFDHMVLGERLIAGWLESERLRYDVFSDDDLDARPERLAGYKVLLLPVHPEYYTERMYQAVSKHLERGGHLLYLGGNGIWGRVTRSGNQIEYHPDQRRHDHDGSFGGIWSIRNPTSQAAVLGVEYDARGWNTYADYEVVAAGHPAFRGTGLAAGDRFAPGGSGFETDKLSRDSPKDAVLLARGTNADGGGSDMVIYRHAGGGIVFATGSIAFARALRSDRKAGMVLRNVIDDMLR